ncbi:Transient receptor putative cation channel sub A member 1 [Nowakowskiella sp. JEL0407]|nr:Transient receptor putative cation channel sub A member 1 [Nowakowskiella sp. JEL0407]
MAYELYLKSNSMDSQDHFKSIILMCVLNSALKSWKSTLLWYFDNLAAEVPYPVIPTIICAITIRFTDVKFIQPLFKRFAKLGRSFFYVVSGLVMLWTARYSPQNLNDLLLSVHSEIEPTHVFATILTLFHFGHRKFVDSFLDSVIANLWPTRSDAQVSSMLGQVFHYSIFNGNLGIVKHLGAKLERVAIELNTATMTAVKSLSKKKLKLLRYVHGLNPLRINHRQHADNVITEAAKLDEIDIVRFAVENGCTLLHEPCFGSTIPLHIAAANSAYRVAEFILQDSTSGVCQQNNVQETPVHISCRRGDLRMLQLFITYAGSLVESIFAKNYERYPSSPLYMAINFHRMEIVNFILYSGYHIDPASIHVAVRFGDVNMCRDLIARGIDVNHYAETNLSPPQKPETPLHLLAFETSAEKMDIAELLIESGADVDFADSNLRAPLHRACIASNLLFVKLILNRSNQSLNLGDFKQYTPLHYSTSFDNIELLDFLLQSGALIDPENDDGNTPLLNAVKWEHRKAAKFLLDRGADAEKTNHSGDNVFHLCSAHTSISVMKMLCECLEKDKYRKLLNGVNLKGEKARDLIGNQSRLRFIHSERLELMRLLK